MFDSLLNCRRCYTRKTEKLMTRLSKDKLNSNLSSIASMSHQQKYSETLTSQMDEIQIFFFFNI